MEEDTINLMFNSPSIEEWVLASEHLPRTPPRIFGTFNVGFQLTFRAIASAASPLKPASAPRSYAATRTSRRTHCRESRYARAEVATYAWSAAEAAQLAARGESRFLLVYTGAVAFSLQLPELVIQCGHGHGQLHAEETAGSDLDCAPDAGARS